HIQTRKNMISPHRLSIVYKCPKCQELIYVEHINRGQDSHFSWVQEQIYPYNLGTENFGFEVENISPSFYKIYNQSRQAENMGLDEICGVGYRKALEFLIKDYAKLENPDEVETIENTLLKKCIDRYIDNPEIKACATGATYLGNDETHYVKRWIDKDIKDLKSLIKLTLAWINMKEATKKYKNEMNL
ncbi:hypothetical protein, partial [Paraclostridium bifermentans]